MINNLADTQHSVAWVEEGSFYHFKEWRVFPLWACFSHRFLNFKEESARGKLCKILDIKREHLVIPEQEHQGKVRVAKHNNFSEDFYCDALLTQEPRLALTALTADCLSIFLYDPLHKIAGIVHAGWRSSQMGIVKNCILLMQKEFGVSPNSLRVAIGPGIRECCYEVKEDLADYFPGHIEKRNNQFFLDLAGVNLKQLSSLGVERENIIDSRICSTCHNDNFFSYRREGEPAGRTISVIMLK